MNANSRPQPYAPRQVLAQAFGLDPALLFSEDGGGRVQLDGALLHLQLYQENVNVLLLMADLGPLPARDRQACYQQMLVANSGWSALAGGALCTTENGENALLRLRLDLDTLGSEVLVQWLTAFVTAAEHWAGHFTASAAAASAAAASAAAASTAGVSTAGASTAAAPTSSGLLRQEPSFLHPTHMA